MNKSHVTSAQNIRLFELWESDNWHNNRVRWLSASDLAALAHVSTATAYRWINGSAEPSTAQTELLRLKIFGHLPHWPAGWRFTERGELCTPGNRTLSATDLEFIENYAREFHSLDRRCTTLERENRLLREEVERRTKRRYLV